LPWRSRDKTKTKTLIYKTEAKISTLKAKTPKSKTKIKAVKICLKATARRGTAARHHITG